AGDRLDGDDLGRADAVDRRDAGPRRIAVDMHGARAAQRHAATELGAGHAEHVAQHPQERRVAVDVDAVRSAVDFDPESHRSLLLAAKIVTCRSAQTSAPLPKFVIHRSTSDTNFGSKGALASI